MKLFAKLCYILFLLLTGYSAAVMTYVFAQEEDDEAVVMSDEEFPHWRYWDSNNGLKDNWVETFNHDPWGNLIISQEKQSSFFDGYQFEFIKTSSRNDRLYQNLDHQIWSPNFFGLEIYEDGEYVSHDIRRFIPEYNEKFPFREHLILSLHRNEYYILGPNVLLFYDARSKSITTLKSVRDTPLKRFLAIKTDYKQTVWILGEHGMAEIPLLQTNWYSDTEWNYHLLPEDMEVGTNVSFEVYSNKECCVVANDVNRPNVRKLIHFKNNQWILLHTGLFGSGWLGHDDGFWLQRFNNQTKEFYLTYHSHGKTYLIKPNRYTRRIFDMLSFSKESFYISSPNGIAMFTAPTWRQDETIPMQQQPFISETAGHETQQWFLTRDHLLSKKDEVWTTVKIPEVQERGFYRYDSLRKMNDNKILIFCSNMVTVYDPATNTFTDYFHKDFNSSVFIPVFDYLDDGTLLFGTRYYKDRFVVETFDFQNYETLYDFQESNWDNNLSTLLQHSNGTIWFTTLKQLYWLNQKELIFPQEIPDSIFFKTDFSDSQYLFERENGNVILVKDHIYEYDGTDLKPLFMNDQSYYDRIVSVFESADRTLWFAANNGVHRYRDGLFITNTYEDGLFDDNVNFVSVDEQNQAYAGGQLGLRLYHPNSDPYPPETYIQSEVNLTDFTNQSDIRFEVSGKDRWNFTKTNRLFYSYKINNGEWSTFKEKTSINVTGLHSGDHTLFVRAMDRSFNIDQSPAEFAFRINPPWYLETAFLVWSILASFVTFLFGYYAVKNYAHLKMSLAQTRKTVTLLEQTKEDLTRAKVRAESATKAKNSFLARMSHEIRTPLNGIVGNLELLTIVEPEEQKTDLIRLCNLSAQTLQGIIGDVLDFAKIEADLFELDQVDVQLRSIFEEVFSMLCVRANQKQLMMIADWDPKNPVTVKTDPIRIRQVLINLINNAIKFTDQGGVFIRMYCLSQNTEKAEICFEVLDTGMGFNQTKKAELFKEFVQDENSKKMSEGTGLGLPICQRIVQLMGGTIDCEGYAGVGARFWFTIPLPVVEGPKVVNQYHNIPKLLMFHSEPTHLEKHVVNALPQREHIWDSAQTIEEIEPDTDYHFVMLFSNTTWHEIITPLKQHCSKHTKYILITDDHDPFTPFVARRAGFHYVFHHKVDTKHLMYLLSSEGQFSQMANEHFEKRININEIIETVSFSHPMKPVLVIDDVKTNQLLTRTQLKQLSIECDIASNGMEGLEKTAANDYSMIFVDCSMPEMDGFEFTKQFREREAKMSNQRKPVIAMTAHVISGIRERCLETGMDDYISKPVRFEIMVEKLRKWLKQDKIKSSKETNAT